MSDGQHWMVYGANGYTGELIAREAVRRGLRPILAGRNADAVARLARELGLEWRAFDLDRTDLSGISLVLHCAGPFVHTSRPMVDACLAAGAHYLDITGEIGVFESIFARAEEARQRGVTLLPGVGFDVVPTDCLAAMLHARLPDATSLALAFSPRGGGISRGTMKTAIEGAAYGGAIRRDGVITPVPQLWDVREIEFSSGTRTAASIPWGDVSTAFHTTGIPDIRVYSAQSPRAIRRMKRMRFVLPLLRVAPLRRLAQSYAGRHAGPDDRQRAAGSVELWGEASNARGAAITMTMTVAEGYTFTARSAVEAAMRVLAGPKPGAFTPAQLLGPDFVRGIEGTVVDS
jgi:short subunit dehydrogenase-like uncharacterized protein